MVIPYDPIMSADKLTLAGEFATPTREQWLELVDGVLKGASFDQKLVTHTYDGVSIQPLYTAATAVADGVPGVAPFVRGSRPGGQLGGWDVRQYHADPDPVATNAAILADLERGVTSIWLRVGGNGVPVADLDRALDGVYLDLAPDRVRDRRRRAAGRRCAHCTVVGAGRSGIGGVGQLRPRSDERAHLDG